MLTDDCGETRKLAYTLILEIRKNKASRDSVRKFFKPEWGDYNFNATSYYQLNRSMQLEPPYTKYLDQLSFESLAKDNKKLSVPAFLCHAQDTERTVAMMNQSIGRIAGIEKQNAIMRHKYISRKENGRITKKSYQTYHKRTRVISTK